MLLVLSLINFFNYLDRQVIFPLFSHIKFEFNLTDYQLGLLGTVFVFVFSLSTIPMGFLADRYARRTVIACGVLFWSIATFFSGLATNFRTLLQARSLVGVGEASYNPAASAMMADNFHHSDRARVQGIFYIGAFLGGIIGTIIGGLIVHYTNNWRYAFYVVALPGFILALLSLTIKDKKVARPQTKFTLKPFLSNKPYLLIIVSGIFSSFAAGSYLSWGVEYVHRYTNYNLRDSSIYLGVAMIFAGTVGISIGSYLADKCQAKHKDGRSMLVAFSLILSAPFLLLGFNTAYTGVGFFVFFSIGITLMSFYLGPASAVIHDVTEPRLRATAFAIYLFATHILGDTLSPAITGLLSDMFNLKVAMMYVTVAVILSGLAFLATAHYIKRDNIKLWQE